MSGQSSQSEGFTLIEVMAVLILMALLSSLAVVSLHAATRQTDWEQTCARFSCLDRSTRDQAIEMDAHWQIRMDLQTMVISRWLCDDTPSMRSSWSLPDHQRIATMLIDGATPQGRDVYIPVSNAGFSPTYAICIASYDQAKWVVFAGLSGQMWQSDSGSQVQEMFHALARTDTH